MQVQHPENFPRNHGSSVLFQSSKPNHKQSKETFDSNTLESDTIDL